MPILRYCFYSWLIAFVLPVSASIVAPGDVPYYRLRQGQTVYIYDATSRDLLDQLTVYNQAIRAMYDQSFAWKLDEEMDLVLTSSHQQIANAYATVTPNIKTVWYPAGAALIDEMAVSSWATLLNAHEVSHLYQLNAKGSFNSALKSVFGNAFVLFFPLSPIVPIFIHPNFLTPTFMIEGNATFNESRLNFGGRLYSGEKRALVLAQIAAGDITPSRLINDGFEFPFGEEPYMQGAYFQAHLAAKYGVEKTNQFFVEQGKHFIWPLILNKTFRDHFGSSYPQEIREYVHNMEGLAKKQQSTGESPIVRNLFVGQMNHDANRVFFVSSDAKQPPQLRIFDKTTRTLESKQLDLFSGKVFWESGKPETAASDQHDIHHTEYSLYGEGARLDPRFRGQIVTDRRAGMTVALDAGDSWAEPRMLLNGEPYDISHSHPILDDQGNVYYFRQNGAERILYRNREPITKYEGFYGKPLEVTPDGTFYFIASTDFGSSLYRLKGREISRVLKSDRVIDARWLGGDDFLVTEVGAEGHAVMVAKAQIRPASPAVYSYGFPPANIVPGRPEAELLKQERPYNSFGQIRYSYLDMSTGYSSGIGALVDTRATFTDPLEYQNFSAGYAGSQFGDREAMIQYQFTKYVPDFFARYIYKEDRWLTSTDDDRRAYNQEVDAGFRLPVLRWRRWDASFGLAMTYEKNDAYTDPASAAISSAREETYGARTTLGIEYSLAPGLGFLPWRAFSLNYVNHLESETDGWKKKYNTSLIQSRYTHGFPEEFYATLAASYAWAEIPDISVDYEQGLLSQEIRIPRLTSHNDEYIVKHAGSVRLEVTNVRTIPAYSPRIPFGLNRLAPVVVGQAIFMDNDPLHVYPPNTFEWGWGADIELLLMHKVPVRLRFLNSYDTRNPKSISDKEAKLTYRMNF